jgi:hypothetical protein
MNRVYLAGPLFTTAERDFNAALAGGLRIRGHRNTRTSVDDDHSCNDLGCNRLWHVLHRIMRCDEAAWISRLPLLRNAIDFD